MSDSNESVAQIFQGHKLISKIVNRNVLNPILWLTVVMCLFCFPAAYIFRDDNTLKYILILFPLAVATVALSGFIYFSLRWPQLLHTEEFLIQQQALQIAETTGLKVPFNPSIIPAITNPLEPNLLGDGSEVNQ